LGAPSSGGGVVLGLPFTTLIFVLTKGSTLYKLKIENNKNLKFASKVWHLFTDENISDETEFGEVRHVAFGILERAKFPSISKYMSKASFDEVEYEWDHYNNCSQAFKMNLRPPFLAVDLESQTIDDHLVEAVEFLKSSLKKNKSLSQFKTDDIPQDFIPEKVRRYLYKTGQNEGNGKERKEKQLDTDKYEFLIYQLLQSAIQSGDVYCSDSTQFRSFEDELIERKQWEENWKSILQSIDYPRLRISIEELLAQLEKELETLIITVNKRIKDGQNKQIKITGKGDNIKWSLPYKKPEDTENHSFYSHLPQVGIGDLLHAVNEQCGFLEAFTHKLGRYVKSQADNSTIIAGIIALATNTGLNTMGEISDINSHTLNSTAKNFIRLETLRNANDMISNAIAQNPFFSNYDIEEGIIHSSSDGQKFETQIKTINARYSPKYFGLKEGVTSLSLSANHVPINAKIIGANESESHYVFDILFNNTSEIKPDRHSTDTHGTNNINHILLYLFDYMFAPRYKGLRSKAAKICGFKSPGEYKDCLIKPSRKVKTQRIIEEAGNILRIMASLALKTTTQSIIVRKLSSHAKKNKTQKAIRELNDIVYSIYILKYVDDLLLRHGVQRALNRNESYHKLKRAVTYAYSGKFREKQSRNSRFGMIAPDWLQTVSFFTIFGSFLNSMSN